MSSLKLTNIGQLITYDSEVNEMLTHENVEVAIEKDQIVDIGKDEGGFIKGITPKTDRLEGMILSGDYEWEDAPMLAGEVLLFSMFLVHKSGSNSTKDSIRFTIQIRYNDLADNNFAERGFNPLEEF